MNIHQENLWKPVFLLLKEPIHRTERTGCTGLHKYRTNQVYNPN